MTDDVKKALRNLIAIERDRQLGYPHEDLHMDPTQAIVEGLDALEELGDDPNEIVWPEDQETLGITEEIDD